MGDETTTSVETDSTVLTETPSTVLTDGTNSEAGDTLPVDDAASGDSESSTDGDAGSEGESTIPDTYADFDMPEGVVLDEALLTDAEPIFKDLGLTQDQAQKLIDFHAKQVQAGSQKQLDTFNQLTNEWLEQSKNDGEFGGDKFDENVKIAQAAVSKYGTPELKQLLGNHGIGNNPEMIRFMVRIGQTLKEDIPGSSGATTSESKDHASILYPNQKDS